MKNITTKVCFTQTFYELQPRNNNNFINSMLKFSLVSFWWNFFWTLEWKTSSFEIVCFSAVHTITNTLRTNQMNNYTNINTTKHINKDFQQRLTCEQKQNGRNLSRWQIVNEWLWFWCLLILTVTVHLSGAHL